MITRLALANLIVAILLLIAEPLASAGEQARPLPGSARFTSAITTRRGWRRSARLDGNGVGAT